MTCNVFGGTLNLSQSNPIQFFSLLKLVLSLLALIIIVIITSDWHWLVSWLPAGCVGTWDSAVRQTACRMVADPPRTTMLWSTNISLRHSRYGLCRRHNHPHSIYICTHTSCLGSAATRCCSAFIGWNGVNFSHWLCHNDITSDIVLRWRVVISSLFW